MSELPSFFSWSPVFPDKSHLRQIIDGMEALNRSELFFMVGSSFFVKSGEGLKRVNFFEEENSLGSLEEDQREIVAEILDIYREGKQPFRKVRERIDVFFKLAGSHFRAVVESCQAGTNVRVEIRRIKENLFTLKGLGYPDSVFQKLIEIPSGIVVITGPSEGEINATALSMVHEIASLRNTSAVCFEDHLNSLVYSRKTMIIQKVYGFDFFSWNSVKKEGISLASVVYIADIDSKDKASTALYLAASGKLVIVSISAVSLPSAFQKIESMFSPEERNFLRGQLASNFKALVYQNFLPKKDMAPRKVLSFSTIFSSPRVATLLMEGKYKQLEGEALSSYGVPYISSLKFLYKKGLISEDSFVSEQKRYYGYIKGGGEG